MPTFDKFEQSQTIKMLYLGHSGAGKTGSTAALAAAGYNVRVLDLDKGVEVLAGFVNDPASPYRHDSSRPNDKLRGWEPVKGLWTEEQGQSISSRMTYVALDETLNIQKIQNSQIRTAPKGDLYAKIQQQFNDWMDEGKSFGSILDWTVNDVLVIDGLSRFSDAVFNQQLALNGRLLGRPEQSDFGAGQREIIRNLMLLYSSAIKCHVIMICHLKFIETDQGPTRGFPQTIGKAIAPEMGQFFNHALLAETSGQGLAQKRLIKTNTSGMIELKSPAPLRVRPEYALATGLAEYFRDVRGPAPAPSGKTP